MKILVVGTGSFGPYSRDELVAEILKEHPGAEVVTHDTTTLAQGMAFDFVAYDEAARLEQTFTLEYRPTAYISANLLGFAKKGRRRGQRRQEKSYSWRK